MIAIPAPSQPHDDGTLQRFLSAVRARIDPTTVGLHPKLGRRLVGLTQKDVAQLAGISLRTYQFLELAERTSPWVVDAVAAALRLTKAQTTYLQALAQGLARPDLRPARRTAQLRSYLSAVATPALVHDPLLNVVDANAAMVASVPSLARGRKQIGLIDWLFSDAAAGLLVDHRALARAAVGVLRANRARYRDPEPFDQRAAALARTNPDFARYWDDETFVVTTAPSTIHVHGTGGATVTLPVGRLALDHDSGLLLMLVLPSADARP